VTWSIGGRPVRRALVARLRYLGDVAMSTVVARALREGDPRLDIGFLCEAAYAPLLQGQPDCDCVHPLVARRRSADARARGEPAPARPADEAGAAGARLEPAAGTPGTIAALRARRYDLAVDLFFNPRSAVLLAAAGARVGVGGGRGWRRWLYTHDAPPLAARPQWGVAAPGGLGDHLSRLAPLHHEESGRGFADWLEARSAGTGLLPRLRRPPLNEGAARRGMSGLGADGGGFVLLAPGATWPAKEWPGASWGALAKALAGAQARPVVFLAPPLRAAAYAAAAAAVPPGRGGMLPPLPLAEALRAVAAADLVVAVDGGIMHAAVAMGRPTVALFGPTDPGIWFPYAGRGPFRVLATRPPCHPCDRHTCDAFVCLPDLRSAEVLAECLALLAEAGAAS